MENIIEEWGKLDNNVKNEIKWIVQSHWKNGTAKSNAITRIYCEIIDFNKYLLFDEIPEFMEKAENFYNYVLEKFILKGE